MSIHLGKAIRGLTVVNTARDFWKLKHASHSSHQFILYHNSGVPKKKITQTSFWVSSKYKEKGKIKHWVVMPHTRKTSCADELFTTLYSSQITGPFKYGSRYPWPGVWYDISVKNPPVTVIRLPRDETTEGWSAWYAELQNGDLVPLRGRYTGTFSSEEVQFFPVPPASAFGNIYPQQSCFQQDCIQWPMRYTVSLKRDGSAEEIPSTLLLGPTASTIKLHTGIRKHVYGLDEDSQPNENRHWRDAFGWSSGGDGTEIFKPCPPACSGCDGEKGKVYGVHRLLEQDILRYLKTGITFLSKAATNINRVEIYKTDPVNSGDCLNISLEVRIKGTPGKTLVVRGWTCDPHYSYFYVNVLTIYAGTMNRKIINENIVFTGKLMAITRN